MCIVGIRQRDVVCNVDVNVLAVAFYASMVGVTWRCARARLRVAVVRKTLFRLKNSTKRRVGGVWRARPRSYFLPVTV